MGEPRNTMPGPASGLAAEASRSVLGKIDIWSGLPESARNAVGNAVPNAMRDPSRRRRVTDIDRMTPKPRPGFVQRWVRIKDADGRDDVGNKAEAFETGWAPRRSNTLKSDEFTIPCYDPGDGKGGVIVFRGELLLCEMPKEQADAIQADMDSQFDDINRVIYQGTQNGNGELGLPQNLRRFGSLNFEDGRDAAALIED